MSVLNLNERWLLNLLDTIDEGIHAVDVDGVTLVYNRAAAAMDGLRQTDVLGKHVLSMFPSLGQNTSTLMQVLKTGKPLLNSAQTYTNYLGLKVHTVNTTLPIIVAGRVVGAVEIAKNLTQVKNLSEQVLSLQAQVVGHPKRKPRKDVAPSGARAHYHFTDILTNDSQLSELKQRAQLAAKTSSQILVCGETGTGKELLVQAIHNASPRESHPFLALNCAALPATLLEGLLFGTVRGSFTGAENRAGLFELADGGTLFLDEIQSMPLDLQAKLLRVLQEGEILRVGDTHLRHVDVRVIAAMNEPPETALEKHELRQDLYYRINVVRLDLPPLRERRADISLLQQHFVDKLNGRFNSQVEGVTDAVHRAFQMYPWPGNVRELENAIEAAMNLIHTGFIEMDLLPRQIRAFGSSQSTPLQFFEKTKGGQRDASGINLHSAEQSPLAASNKHLQLSLEFAEQLPAWAQQLRALGMNEFWESVRSKDVARPALPEITAAFERILLMHALNTMDGNVKRTAEKLGIPRQTLQYRLRQTGLASNRS